MGPMRSGGPGIPAALSRWRRAVPILTSYRAELIRALSDLLITSR